MQKTKLSSIIAGTMNWGAWGKKFTTSEMIACINSCLENNITTFDHADIYGGYTTETDFGVAFSKSKIDRNKIQIITKCGIQSISDNRKTTIKHYDYSQKHIFKSVENSLKNLQTDYLDVLLLHRPSPLLQAEEVANTIEKLKKDGKIISFGLSNFSALQTQLLQKYISIEFNQIQFSVTHLEPMTNGSLDFMQTNNIVPMSWNPLGTVFKQNDEKSERIKLAAQKLSLKYNVTIDVILIAWILKHPAGIYPVFGTTDVSRIKNLTKAIHLQLDLQDWFTIWEANLGRKVD